MPKTLIIILSLLLCFSANAETVFKKVNPDGSVEFTDRDSKGSEEIKVREPVTYPAPSLPAPGLPVTKMSPAKELYSLAVINPVNDSTITDSHDVTVSISLSPSLNTLASHQIRYQLGSETISGQQMSVTFNNVERGTHTINVSVVNQAGDSVSTVATSTFHMKRFFVKPAPKPPAKPKVP